MKIDIRWEEDVENLGGYDPTDEWSRDSFRTHPHSFSAHKSDLGEFEVPDGTDIVKAVVAVYSTGDTFGYDEGNVQVMDVFDNDKDALGLYRVLENPKYEVVKNGQTIYQWEREFKGKSYHPSWFGYFEQLESLDIKTLIVQAR